MTELEHFVAERIKDLSQKGLVVVRTEISEEKKIISYYTKCKKRFTSSFVRLR